MPDKIKNPIVIEGLILLFSWIFGLMIDDTIQKNIIQYPDSHKIYQFIQSFLNIDKVITPIFIFLWIVGTLTYIIHSIRE